MYKRQALYSGSLQGVDVDLLLGSATTVDDLLFGAVPSFSFFDFIEFQDDTVDNVFGGPFGDPFFDFAVPNSGLFTLVVAAFDISDGVSGGVSVSAQEVPLRNVPEPSAGLLLFCSAGFLVLRRRQR